MLCYRVTIATNEKNINSKNSKYHYLIILCIFQGSFTYLTPLGSHQIARPLAGTEREEAPG